MTCVHVCYGEWRGVLWCLCVCYGKQGCVCACVLWRVGGQLRDVCMWGECMCVIARRDVCVLW